MKPSIIAMFVLGLLLASSVLAAPISDSTDFSGYEIFPGITSSSNQTSFGSCVATNTGRVTKGATFTGWPDNATDEWVSASHSTGGIVSGSIDYIGAPGLGHTVCVIGGIWSWHQSDKIFFGGVTSGEVQWPASGDDIGCGTDIGVFTANLAVANTHGTGTIDGCLDDEDGLLIPKIWGALTVN